MFIFLASSISSSRNLGWAMLMRARAFSLMLAPASLAMPYSVTTYSMSVRGMETGVPG